MAVGKDAEGVAVRSFRSRQQAMQAGGFLRLPVEPKPLRRPRRAAVTQFGVHPLRLSQVGDQFLDQLSNLVLLPKGSPTYTSAGGVVRRPSGRSG